MICIPQGKGENELCALKIKNKQKNRQRIPKLLSVLDWSDECIDKQQAVICYCYTAVIPEFYFVVAAVVLSPKKKPSEFMSWTFISDQNLALQ